MQKLWTVPLLVLLAACGSSETEPDQEPDRQPAPSEGTAPAEGEQARPQRTTKAAAIKDYKDLEEFAGKTLTIEGKFGIYPKFKGRHAMITLDSGLVIYIPHADIHWKGTNWWLHEGKRVAISGKLDVYVDFAIDGMHGPFLNDPSGLSETGDYPEDEQPGVPKQANPR